MTVCIKLFTEKMRIAQYADNTKPASFPIIMITLVAAVQQPGAYRLAGETKLILLLYNKKQIFINKTYNDIFKNHNNEERGK